MGLFDFFKKPSLLHDDYFGQLQYINSKDPSKNYFEGKGFFVPTKSETQYLIMADVNGPVDAQKKFYQELQNNFDSYIQKIKPLIEDEFRNWKEAFTITDFKNEFRLVFVIIPRTDAKPYDWQMAFSTVHDLDHLVTIDFINDEPASILIDG